MKLLLIFILIIVIPSAIWLFLTWRVRHSAMQSQAHVQGQIDTFQTARCIETTVSSTEILNGWTVLQLTRKDKKTGFYLKTASRSHKVGDTVQCYELPEQSEREALLRNNQIFPDDSGKMIFAEDFSRLMNGLHKDLMEADRFYNISKYMFEVWLWVIIPLCLIACFVVYIFRKSIV